MILRDWRSQLGGMKAIPIFIGTYPFRAYMVLVQQKISII